ncbi:MAG: hypothetical protein AAGD25_34170 [Cyanobacteria bacterium P01_F01_bin.150]
MQLKKILIRLSIVIFSAVLLSLSPMLPHEFSDAAPTCRTTNGHTICLLTIKRSAKNYWEYRASVKIDDQIFPVQRYNCRDRTKTDKAGHISRFQPNGAGTLICQLLYR